MFDLVDALPASRYDFVRLCPVRDNETQQGVIGMRSKATELVSRAVVRYTQFMPSSEGPQTPPPDQGSRQPEHQSNFYSRAARFNDEPSSGRAYFQAQEAIRINPCDLSSYRLQLRCIWHV